MSSPVLQAIDLSVSYGEAQALSDTTFSLSSGELVAVVGPNGAGKSTMFKALAGFVDHEGDVVVHGHTCHHHERQAIAYIPQQSDIDLRFPITVSEVVMTGRRRFHGARMSPTAVDTETVKACLAQVDLADMGNRSLSTLSGGQVQRVMLARAIAQEADVLLLDEALSGVDTAHTEELIALFQQLQARGTSILVSTHDLALVRSKFARCLAVNGSLRGDGAPAHELTGHKLEDLFSHAPHEGHL